MAIESHPTARSVAPMDCVVPRSTTIDEATLAELRRKAGKFDDCLAMSPLGRSILVSAMESLNQLRELAEQNIPGPVECLLTPVGSWDVRWNNQGESCSANNLDHRSMLKQLESLAVQ